MRGCPMPLPWAKMHRSRKRLLCGYAVVDTHVFFSCLLCTIVGNIGVGMMAICKRNNVSHLPALAQKLCRFPD